MLKQGAAELVLKGGAETGCCRAVLKGGAEPAFQHPPRFSTEGRYWGAVLKGRAETGCCRAVLKDGAEKRC